MAIFVKLKMIDVTMKKIYKTPTTNVVKVELTHMIAISTLGNTDATSGNLSRRGRSVWDDEEEDDDDDYGY